MSLLIQAQAPTPGSGGNPAPLPHLGLLLAAAGGGFNAAFMAAMSWPWPIIVFSKPLVVAAGQMPPDQMPN